MRSDLAAAPGGEGAEIPNPGYLPFQPQFDPSAATFFQLILLLPPLPLLPSLTPLYPLALVWHRYY